MLWLFGWVLGCTQEHAPPPDSADTGELEACTEDYGEGLPVSDLGTCTPTLRTTPATPETRTVNGVTRHENLFIATRGDHALHGDLHLPETTGQTGALVVVHGGGWLDCENRRGEMDYYAQAVAEVLGVPTFKIDYRLAQEGGGYPENVMDVKCGVQWLREHAPDYGIDPDRIGVMGTSAGAHLATMVALTEHRSDLDPQCAAMPPEVSLTLAYSGPYDLPSFVAGPSLAREAPLYYTAEDCEAPVDSCESGPACSTCVDASPMAHVCHADSDPILLFQAPDPLDPFVPAAQATAMAEALTEAGAEVQLLLPSTEQMAAAGCPSGSTSHGADLCLLTATGDALNAAVRGALGPE